MNTEKEKAFLEELKELSRKHGLIIWGCGCCGSPSLCDMAIDEKDGKYYFNEPREEFDGDLGWGKKDG
jgi:hypothetical protein